MKKILLISSLLITFAGILFTSSPYLLKITGLDEPLKQYLLPKLLKNPQDRLDFKDFRIGLSTIYLNDITASVENGHIALHIDAIEINFNLMRLLQNPSKPQRTISAIRIIRPKIVVNRALLYTNSKVSVTADTQKTSLRNLFETFNEIRSIDRLAIRDGQIDWINRHNKYFLLAHHVNGWLDARDFEDIVVESEGNLLASDENNFSLSIRINPVSRTIRANIHINEQNVGKTFSSLVDGDLSILNGEISGEINIVSKDINPDSTLVDGTLVVKHGELQQEENTLKDIRFFAKIKNNSLVLDEGGANYAEQYFSFSAEANNIFHPIVHASINGEQFSLKHLNGYLPFPELARSNIDVKFNLTTDFNTYSLQAEARCDSLYLFKNEAFTNVILDAEFKDNVFYLKKLQGRLYDLDIDGNGRYMPDANQIIAQVNSNYKLANYSVLDRLSLKNQSTRLSLKYNLASQTFTGSWGYLIAAENDTIFTSYGNISGDRDRLNLKMKYCSDPDFSFYVNIQNFLSNKLTLDATLVNYPLSAFTSDPALKEIFEHFETDTRMSGTFSQLKGQIQVTDKENGKNNFRLNTVINYPLSGHRGVKGSISFRNLLGFYDIDLTPEKIEAVVRFPAGIYGMFSFAPGLDDAVSGAIRFKNFNILQTFKDSTLTEDFRVQGTINGTVLVDGTIRNPKFIADLSGDKFVFNDIGYYQANLHAAADKKRLTIDSLDISLNNVNILRGIGYWNLQKDLVDFKFSGHGLDMQQLVASITDDDRLFSGMANYKILLSGSTKNPSLKLSATVQNGILQDLAFDKLTVSMEDRFDDLHRIYDWTTHTIFINNFYLGRAGRYHLSANGVFPIDKSKPLDLNFDFDGDLLSFIPYWESFFVDGASLTTLNLEVTGTPKNIRIKKGKLVIDRGELWLADVASHVENITGTIEFVEGTNHVNIKNLLAHVDNTVLRINTERNVTLPDGRKLEHWYFKDLNLDFGILALQTSKKGVKIHIPGLMHEEETGHIFLTGLDERRPFYFAGPIRNPRAIGKVLLFNTYLTYPFLVKDNGPDEPSVAVRFLSKIDWDLYVNSGEDVVYFRKVPAFIDNVDMELYVDETSKGLKLQGIINQGTFKPDGEIVSTRGRLEYLDQVFRVDRFSVEFSRNNPLPFVSGRAWTTIRDSVGAVPKTIYLDLYAVDSETGLEKQEGSWEDFKFKLVSADPQIGETQEQVLAYMGYSVGNAKKKAVQVGGAVTERYLIRPLLRPVEKALERGLGMDMVRINSAIAQNLFYSTLGSSVRPYGRNYYLNPFLNHSSILLLMQSSGVTVGKYLSRNLFLTYSGQLVSIANQTDVDFGFNHSLGLEYRFLKNVLLEFRYDREFFGIYSGQPQQQYLNDFKIRLRHSFSF